MDDDGIRISGMRSPSYKDPPVAAPSPPASSSYPPWLYTDAQRTKGKEIVSRARTARRLFEENSSPPQQPAQASPLSSQAVASEWSTSSRAGPVPSPFHYRVESPEYPQTRNPLPSTLANNGAISSADALKKRLGNTESLPPFQTYQDNRNPFEPVNPFNPFYNPLLSQPVFPGPIEASHAAPTNFKADGVWAAEQSTDVTIHLTFDVQEDIDDVLEGFSQWHQIGNFKNARHYFSEQLKEHMENPYVLVHYMEMLLDQGHYLAVKPFCQRIIHFLNLSDSSRGQSTDSQFLKVYAELVASFAVSHGPCHIEKLTDTLDSALVNLNLITWDRAYQGGSTEIRLMSTLFRFRSRCQSQANKDRFSKLLEWAGLADGLKSILANLLRDGRVWDMCLLVKAVAEANCLGLSPDKVVEWLNELVSAWKPSHDADVATKLALLDLLVFVASDPSCSHYRDAQPGILELARPLAQAISQQHPESMKSRPYVRWILARVSCITRSSNSPPTSLHSHTRPFGGLSYDWDTGMPIYIPIGAENPGWKQAGAAPDMLELTRLALNTALETEDYKTEVIALQNLINLSASPDEEFEELCHLQKVVQGDIEGYVETLVSKYLICKTDQAKDQLRKDIREQVTLPTFEISFSGNLTWLSNMLFSTLESDEQQASTARDRADKCWFRLEPDLRQAIIQKPHLTRHLFTDNAIDTYRETMRQAEYEFFPAYDVNRETIGKKPELVIEKNESDTMRPDMGYHDKTADWLAANFANVDHFAANANSAVPQRPKPSFRNTTKPSTRRSVRFDHTGSFHKEHAHGTSRRTKRKNKNKEHPGEAVADIPTEKGTEPLADGVGTQTDIPPIVLSGVEDKQPSSSKGIPKNGKEWEVHELDSRDMEGDNNGWLDEPNDTGKQPPLPVAENEDEAENEPLPQQTHRPLQEVESRGPGEERTRPPARRQTL